MKGSSRRDSHDLPIAKVVSERWILLMDLLTAEGEDKEIFLTPRKKVEGIKNT